MPSTMPHPVRNSEPTTYYIDCADRSTGKPYTLEIPAMTADEALAMAAAGHLIDPASVRTTREVWKPKLPDLSPETAPEPGAASLAVLMEIRDELRTINKGLTPDLRRMITKAVAYGVILAPLIVILIGAIAWIAILILASWVPALRGRY